nr:aspartic proteinase A1-like isoform X2 [Ipomoea batatas]
MVSELAGEGAVPPQLPTPVSHAKLHVCLRRSIRRGSLLSRQYVNPPLDSKLDFFVDVGNNLAYATSEVIRNMSAVLFKSIQSSVRGDSWSRSMKNTSKVLVNVQFAGFNRSLWSRSATCSSKALVNRTSRSRFVRILSKVLISFSFAVFNRSRSVNSSRVLDRVDAMLAVFDSDSWRRSNESLSAVLVPPCVVISVHTMAPGYEKVSIAKVFSREVFDRVIEEEFSENDQHKGSEKSNFNGSVADQEVVLKNGGEELQASLMAIPIQNSAMISRPQIFDVIVSTQQSNIWLNSNCKETFDWSKKGWCHLIGEFADLCDCCASAYKEGGIVTYQKSVLEIGGEKLGGSKLFGIIIPGFASIQLRAWSILDCPYWSLNFNLPDLVLLDTTKLLSTVNCWPKCRLLDPYNQTDYPECKSRPDTGLSAIAKLDPGYIIGPLSSVWKEWIKWCSEFGVDHKHFKGKHTYVPDTQNGYWQFDMGYFLIGNNSTGLCESGCAAIVNFSTSLLTGPTTIVTEINHAIRAEEVVSTECIEIISKYGEMIWDLLVSGVKPDEVCSQVGLCFFNGVVGSNIEMVVEEDNEGKASSDPMCNACEIAVAWVHNQLKQKVVKEKVFDYVNQLCEKIPSPMGESTIDLIEQIGFIVHGFWRKTSVQVEEPSCLSLSF